MQLHTLRPAFKAIKNRKRIARGEGSGRGGTATRGHKGAKSRSGYKSKRGFEGGQLPLQARIPKYGFKSLNRTVYQPINLETLQYLAEKHNVTVIDALVLKKYGLISKHDRYKILGKGTLQAKLQVVAHSFSKAAQVAIEQQAGTITILDLHE